MTENNFEKKERNIFAIIGFILSFFIALSGLIFSIVGLKKSKITNSGKGLSIAGIIISSIIIARWVIAFILVIFAGIIPSLNKSINETISEKYCPQAYSCIANDNDTYNCKFINANGEEKDILCSREFLN